MYAGCNIAKNQSSACIYARNNTWICTWIFSARTIYYIDVVYFPFYDQTQQRGSNKPVPPRTFGGYGAKISMCSTWPVDPVRAQGPGERANYESDFLSLSGIPANQCREYSRLRFAPATLPIGMPRMLTRARARALQYYSLAHSGFRSRCNDRARDVIGNSVSTIIPAYNTKDMQDAGLSRVTGHRRVDAQHPGFAIYRDVQVVREREKGREREKKEKYTHTHTQN